MKSTKIGAIFIISVLALAGVGMSYAAWKKDIDITGTVTTGTLTYTITGYSYWYVYKQVSTGGIVESPTEIIGNLDLHLIAWSEAHEGTQPTEVAFSFNNLFPCIYFKADFKVKYTGSIPAKVNHFTWNWGPQWLINLAATNDAKVELVDLNGNPVPTTKVFQTNDEFQVIITIHIPQVDELQEQTALNVGGQLELIQWN